MVAVEEEQVNEGGEEYQVPPSAVETGPTPLSATTATTATPISTTTTPSTTPASISGVAPSPNTSASTGKLTLIKQTNSTHGNHQPRPIVTMMTEDEVADAIVGEEDDASPVVEADPTGRFERYAISLGRGAYKEVFKAYDQEEGVEVAWNQLKLDAINRKIVDRVFSEIQILQSLRNEHIINLLHSWVHTTQDGSRNVVFITELMTSGTLKSFVRKAKGLIKPKVLKNWCRQILSGLVYLHSRDPPIIHRDLKLDNIFVNGNNGQAKIGDLGLATFKYQDHVSSVLGTPEFMAPELYDEKYNEKVDIYAFGMVVLEMATKEYPYSECQNQAQIYKKVTSGIKPLALGRIQDDETRNFIELCLQFDFEKRPSAAHLLQHPFLVFTGTGSHLSASSSLTHLSQQSSYSCNGIPPIPTPHSDVIADHSTTPQSYFPSSLTSSLASSSASPSTQGVPKSINTGSVGGINVPSSSSSYSTPIASNPVASASTSFVSGPQVVDVGQHTYHISHRPSILPESVVTLSGGVEVSCSIHILERIDMELSLKMIYYHPPKHPIEIKFPFDLNFDTPDTVVREMVQEALIIDERLVGARLKAVVDPLLGSRLPQLPSDTESIASSSNFPSLAALPSIKLHANVSVQSSPTLMEMDLVNQPRPVFDSTPAQKNVHEGVEASGLPPHIPSAPSSRPISNLNSPSLPPTIPLYPNEDIQSLSLPAPVIPMVLSAPPLSQSVSYIGMDVDPIVAPASSSSNLEGVTFSLDSRGPSPIPVGEPSSLMDVAMTDAPAPPNEGYSICSSTHLASECIPTSNGSFTMLMGPPRADSPASTHSSASASSIAPQTHVPSARPVDPAVQQKLQELQELNLRGFGNSAVHKSNSLASAGSCSSSSSTASLNRSSSAQSIHYTPIPLRSTSTVPSCSSLSNFSHHQPLATAVTVQTNVVAMGNPTQRPAPIVSNGSITMVPVPSASLFNNSVMSTNGTGMHGNTLIAAERSSVSPPAATRPGESLSAPSKTIGNHDLSENGKNASAVSAGVLSVSGGGDVVMESYSSGGGGGEQSSNLEHHSDLQNLMD